MRIVSLLPSATEIVYALGLANALVGVTHECDYPPAARSRPIVTHSLLDHNGATSEEIDHAVSQQLHDGLSLYELDHALLAQIAPDLMLTQALCEVCAVAYGDVERAIRDISAAGNAAGAAGAFAGAKWPGGYSGDDRACRRGGRRCSSAPLRW